MGGFILGMVMRRDGKNVMFRFGSRKFFWGVGHYGKRQLWVCDRWAVGISRGCVEQAMREFVRAGGRGINWTRMIKRVPVWGLDSATNARLGFVLG